MRRASRATLMLALLHVPALLAAQAVHPGRIVRIEAPSVLLERFEGVYLGRSGDTLLFGNDKRGPVRVPSAAITRFEVSRGSSRLGGAIRGAAIGGAILTVMATMLIVDPTTVAEIKAEGGSTTAFVVEGAMSGAVVGALTGLFVPTRRWLTGDSRILLSGDPTSTSARAGLSLGF